MVLTLAVLFMVPLVPWVKEKLSRCQGRLAQILFPVLELLCALALALMLLVCICYLVKGTYNPFIYFNF